MKLRLSLAALLLLEIPLLAAPRGQQDSSKESTSASDRDSRKHTTLDTKHPGGAAERGSDTGKADRKVTKTKKTTVEKSKRNDAKSPDAPK